jgi:hypothetical protein
MELIGPAPLTREPLERHAHLQVSTYVRGANEPRGAELVGVSIVSGGVRIRTSYVRTWRCACAAPVRSYCFTVETELIGPAMLNGAPPKHDDMQAVAFVPEMSHFHAQMGRIFVDQLQRCLSGTICMLVLRPELIPIMIKDF